MWEEPPISGENGSGTVFFSGCPLHCIYCQNGKISRGGAGQAVTTDELCSIFLHLQDMGAENINLVTATHFVPRIRGALIKARQEGLRIPVVYNTGSYESVDTIRYLNGLVDIYLPDLKYRDAELAKKYSKAPDYFETAAAAIAEMYRQVGPSTDSPKMIVRHLVLPGCKEDSKAVIKYLWETYGDNVFISIMSQYTPVKETGFENLDRRLTEEEYDEVVDFAAELGITKAFVQEGESAKESFIPDFENWTLSEFLKS